jgi:phosphatidylglycerophosphate synthase
MATPVPGMSRMGPQTTTMATDRRPLATRRLGISKRLAAWLASTGCTPNGISTVGMLLGVLSGVAFWQTSTGSGARGWFLVGALLVQLRLLANMLDGMVAVAQDTRSPVGELYNEIPDRVSDASTLIGLGYAAASWPIGGWLAALLAVITAYVRAQIAVAGGPQDFGGPMAKPHRMFTVTVAALYCGLAPASWQPTALDGHGLPALALAVIAAGSALTTVLRLRRGAAVLRRPR